LVDKTVATSEFGDAGKDTSVKKRRVRKDDWAKIEKFVKNEHEKRENSNFRRDHERKWKEVDRQLRMEEMVRVTEAGQKLPPTWHHIFELGELSKASEIICADVRRITFPRDRSWFEAHVELPLEMTEQGPQRPEKQRQKQLDGVLRSFMVQQHMDFGFKSRVDLSIKEALHHGMFVAEAEWQQHMMVYEGAKVQMVGAPNWVPHSMWNCWPDESPSVEPTSLFYTGSMILRKYMPLYRLKQMSGEGWMPSQFSKIKKEEHKNGMVETSDVALVTYYGDINIERGDGDMYLPNSKVIVANGTIVFYAPIELPFPPIIVGGYERQDPRDPYCTSPLIKQSPTQKIATICANKFIDGIALRTEPPIVYDGNDPYFVMNDGPVIAPGIKTATKGSYDFKQIEVGDPTWALQGLEVALRQMQEGTGVSAVRAGVNNADRQTATEVTKVAQGGEVRTIDFIDKLNANLRTYLYMQHELNKKHCTRYSFYNDELGSPDFIRITKKDVPQNVHFEIVGSKGVLGEEQRAARTASVVGFASQNPLFAPLLEAPDILVEMFQDAGNKNAERFVKQGQPQIPPEVQQKMQEMQQALQQSQQQLQDATLKLKDKSTELKLKVVGAQQDMQQDSEEHNQELQQEREKHAMELRQIYEKHQQELELTRQAAEAKAKKKKVKAKKNPDGSFEFSEE
jgi:hypothetical protein